MKSICRALLVVAGIFAFFPCHAQDSDKPEIFGRYSLEDKWDQSVEEMEKAWDQSAGKIDENILENIPRVEPSPAAPFTGLIIDARGTSLKPCLGFRVAGASGGRLYGQLNTVPDLLRKKGMCGWAGSVKEALTYQRTGLNPIQLKATGISDSHPVSIFIDDEKIDRNLRSKIDIFFKKNAVVIVF